MTVEDAIKKVNCKIKGIYLRSLKNGEVIKKYNDISEIDKNTLSQYTPGSVEAFGYVLIDTF